MGRRLRELRAELDISQEKLAELAGLERAYYWKFENARINATLETLVRVADALSVDVSELFRPASK